MSTHSKISNKLHMSTYLRDEGEGVKRILMTVDLDEISRILNQINDLLREATHFMGDMSDYTHVMGFTEKYRNELSRIEVDGLVKLAKTMRFADEARWSINRALQNNSELLNNSPVCDALWKWE